MKSGDRPAIGRRAPFLLSALFGALAGGLRPLRTLSGPHLGGRDGQGRPGTGYTKALRHIVMRSPDVSADPEARRKWRRQRRKERKAGRR